MFLFCFRCLSYNLLSLCLMLWWCRPSLLFWWPQPSLSSLILALYSWWQAGYSLFVLSEFLKSKKKTKNKINIHKNVIHERSSKVSRWFLLPLHQQAESSHLYRCRRRCCSDFFLWSDPVKRKYRTSTNWFI